eukprot:m.71185 g.71185  ORF g.71185 m.71185 type:complete len:344 (+) comp12286_c0_seq1:677-1708(+)
MMPSRALFRMARIPHACVSHQRKMCHVSTATHAALPVSNTPRLNAQMHSINTAGVAAAVQSSQTAALSAFASLSPQTIMQTPWQLAIFTSNGTLFSVHETHRAWAAAIKERFDSTCGPHASDKLFGTLKYNQELQEAEVEGLLATRPWDEVYFRVACELRKHSNNMGMTTAVATVAEWRNEIEPSLPVPTPNGDLHALFDGLHERNIKIAVIAENHHENVFAQFASYDLGDKVDMVLTASCAVSPKPDPEAARCALHALQCQAPFSIMVGHTPSDVLFAKNADLGLAVAVVPDLDEVHHRFQQGAHAFLQQPGQLLDLLDGRIGVTGMTPESSTRAEQRLQAE